MTTPVPGIYRHYKGSLYEVMGTAQHSVYRALYGGYGLWVRPLAMFMESVTKEGSTQPRFALEKAF